MATLVARLLASAAPYLNTDISQEYKMGYISKGVAKTLKPAKNIYKKKFARNVLSRKLS